MERPKIKGRGSTQSKGTHVSMFVREAGITGSEGDGENEETQVSDGSEHGQYVSAEEALADSKGFRFDESDMRVLRSVTWQQAGETQEE